MNRKKLLIIIVASLSAALALVVTAIFVLPGGTPAAAPVAVQQPQSDERARYVGTTADGYFTVAVVVWNTQAIAYLSDGAANEAWLKGVAQGARLLLTGPGGAMFDGTVHGGALHGTVVVNRLQTSFALPSAQAPAGLYRASGMVGGAQVRFGLIVLPDRRQAGTQWVDGQRQSAPGWDLNSATVIYRGIRLTVKSIEPGDV